MVEVRVMQMRKMVEFTVVEERVMQMRMRLILGSISLVVYDPTKLCGTPERDGFYDKLSSFLERRPPSGLTHYLGRL